MAPTRGSGLLPLPTALSDTRRAAILGGA
jgi:hypothetical protein